MSIVLVGAFNPRIFHPAWLVAHGLVPEGDADTAEINIINNNVSLFTFDWCRIEVLENRFLIGSHTASNVDIVRDLILGMLRTIQYTPIERMGLNRQCHFRLPNEMLWHDFGHRIAPKAVWEPILKNPGMRSINIEGAREDGLPGHTRVVVEPSKRSDHGIYVDINDEFVTDDENDTEWACQILEENWEPHRRTSERIFDHLLRIAVGGVDNEPA
ncbi:hypothetical protein [Protofrankia symbiont of Coriaria ruscifolia]|nr:hypothetical protein [Protofrankia symbiont of Coriaria ruscifolia]